MESADFYTDSRDGQTYRTVRVGAQIWMAQNMNYACPDSWNYENDPANGRQYGRLYSWNGAHRACPPGWRIPDNRDWDRLVEDVGGVGDAGTHLKAKNGWEYNGNGSDDLGFSLLPAGSRFSGGAYCYQGFYASLWSATEHGATYAYNRCLFYFYADLDAAFSSKFNGLSLRCVKSVSN